MPKEGSSMPATTQTAPQAGSPAARSVRSPFGKYWALDPDMTFLNHGSYGVCPLPVREAQDRYRALMEQEPVRWFMSLLERHMDISRARLSELLRCPPECIGFLPNATVAISTILHSIDWRPGDEILVNDHEYMSVINELNRLGHRRGVRAVMPALPFPVRSSDQILGAILSGVTPRTRLVIISHITSPTAMVLPVEQIVSALRQRGIMTLVDGAHAPGCIPVDIQAIGCTYYVATLHKWLCTPKGAGFMYAHPSTHGALRPLALSSRGHQPHPTRPLYLRDFDYLGTDDYSPIACVPDAIEFWSNVVPGGLAEVMRRNHEMAVEARGLLCSVLGQVPACPDSMLPTMATIPLPPLPERYRNAPTVYGDPLQDRLVNEHRIQVPVWTSDLFGLRFLRISSQIYNTLDEYRYLAEVLRRELEREQR
ncbi:MAG: aminotransferase class V-fold PLP-dependent enzyme [Phycisphaeraceae bacterium]|nr:aminotransferase class V-fold PLP-dependent enzyme [Phycisphaeraceae bacterium]